jgi:hypothetical protein
VADVSGFYGASAGAAAALLGLLFVAMQIQPDRLPPALRRRREALAQSTFSIYTHLFLTALLFLIPGLPGQTQAWVVLAGATLGIFRAVRTWIPVWRGIARDAPHRLLQTVWVLVGPLVCYALLIYFSATAATSPGPAVLPQESTGVFIGLFFVVIRNTWSLLMEGATSPEALPELDGGDT